MTAAEKAKDLVNEKYYQPLTLHLNVNNNSREMWDYAKRCANIVADELITSFGQYEGMYDQEFFDSAKHYWESVKIEINGL